ncbi:hypothetical protein FPV67DRAFT_1495648 [Lyophyllum atratum]|nr:hypothetical protein FPV67DRAFT_1495648 [Lyophyllum atratum]
MASLLDLTVTLRYSGHKAQNFEPDSFEAIKVLREDLVTLKLPHPKVENIKITRLPNGQAECEFDWPNAQYQGVLYKHLAGRINGPDNDGTRRQLLKELSIDRLSLHEDYHVPLAASESKQPIYRNKQWRRSDGESMLHTQPALRNEAQMLLDNMASALKIPKNEPIEPVIPDSPGRDSVASSVPSPPALGPSLVHSDDGDGSPMSISSSVRAFTTTPRPIKVLPISPTIPPLRLTPPESTFAPPGLTISTQPQSQPMQAQIQLPSPTHSSRKRSRSPDQWSRRTHVQPTPATNNTMDAQADVTRLTRELWDVRRQITAGVVREASIMSELSALDSRNGASMRTPRETWEDSELRVRLREVEAELMEERKLRSQAEAALEDVKRECREPFVVPALFEAFFMISKATTQAMDSVSSEAASRPAP